MWNCNSKVVRIPHQIVRKELISQIRSKFSRVMSYVAKMCVFLAIGSFGPRFRWPSAHSKDDTAATAAHTPTILEVRATFDPSFTGLFSDHEHKRNLDCDIFTARQQVVGCSEDKITRGHRIKETKKRTKPQPTTGQSNTLC